MNKNCVILIDCWETFPLFNQVIDYLIKYKPKFVINASYPIDFWTPSNDNLIFPKKHGEQLGLFSYIGEVVLPTSSFILNYLKNNNIFLENIISIDEFVKFSKAEDISSVTIVGSSWNNCLHNRPLGINYLPASLPNNIKYFAYPDACVRNNTAITVYEQIVDDVDWEPVINTNNELWEFIGTR
jgi:hypothetical protein